MIVTIQMWIAPISYSNHSAAVIAEAIEVDSKPFKSILPFEVKCYMTCMYKKLHCILCLLFVLNIVHVINFREFHYPRKFFNNEMFPDYGTLIFPYWPSVPYWPMIYSDGHGTAEFITDLKVFQALLYPVFPGRMGSSSQLVLC